MTRYLLEFFDWLMRFWEWCIGLIGPLILLWRMS